MNAQEIQLQPIPVVMLRHRGSYDELSSVFERLWSWVEAQNVPVSRTIGIYWDNPDVVATQQLRSAACVEVSPTFVLADNGGLPLELGEIAGGSYVTARFIGPYEEMAPAWTELTDQIENAMRRTVSDEPAFEVYVNDPSDTPPQELITDLYMPIL